MSQQESLGCVVVWFHHEWQTPAYQVYAGLLFGLPLAVTSFNRFSRLLEALTRRYCQVLTSLYFDDATTTDVRSAKGSGQWAMNQLCLMIGPLFAEDKKQTMQSTGTFLGLTHDLSYINKTGHAQFWARDRLHDKVRDILATARQTGHFSRGTASKLYGLANFLEQGIYGRVGYGGLMAVKVRQDENTTPITSEIEACFEVIEAVMRFQPKREFPVFRMESLRFWQHQMRQSKQTIQDQVASTSYFSNLTVHKPVSVLLQSIVQSFSPYGSLRRPTSPSWSSLWFCMPWSGAPTFSDIDMASGFLTTSPQS